MEIIKDYDCSIHYDPGKLNIMADALSRKSLEWIATMMITHKHILLDFERYDIEVIMRDSSSCLENLKVQSTLVERIKSNQDKDQELSRLMDKVGINLDFFYR